MNIWIIARGTSRVFLESVTIGLGPKRYFGYYNNVAEADHS